MTSRTYWVTGGAGFIGSNLLIHLHKHLSDAKLVNVDKLSYASNLEYLSPIESSDRYEFLQLDITNRDAVRTHLHSMKPDGLFHLAAESHVDNSISGPEPFVMSNVVG